MAISDSEDDMKPGGSQRIVRGLGNPRVVVDGGVISVLPSNAVQKTAKKGKLRSHLSVSHSLKREQFWIQPSL